MWPWHVKMRIRFWCLETSSRQFVADLEGEVLVIRLNFCLEFEHKVWSRFRSLSSGEILELNFGKYFAADAWLRLWSYILVEISKLGLVKILKCKFSRNADVWLRFYSWCFIGMVPITWQGNFICKLILFSLSLIAVIFRAIFGKTSRSEKAKILSRSCCSYLPIDQRMLTIRLVRSVYCLAKFWCIHQGCRRWCSRLSFLWPWHCCFSWGLENLHCKIEFNTFFGF